MGVSVITYGNIEVGPFELTNLQDLQVIKTFNDHAKLTLTGIVPEERRDSYVQMANSQTQVKVVLTDDDGEQKTWFQGNSEHSGAGRPRHLLLNGRSRLAYLLAGREAA